MKRIVTALAVVALATTAKGQTTAGWQPLSTGSMDFGVTVGTTGIGFDLSGNVSGRVRLRTGFSYVPRFETTTTFDIQVGDDSSTSQRKFDRMSGMLQSLTGNPVSSVVDMVGKAKMWNWNVLVDVFPLRNNRHWRVTAGFFLGPSVVAEAFNTTESMPSLMGVDIYNNFYDKLHGVPRKDLPDVVLIDFGYDNVYLDPEMLLYLQKRLDAAGRMGIHMGTYKHDIMDEDGNVVHKAGDEYVMEPDDNHMVTSKMKVNAFKPYLGIGYEGKLHKRNDRLHVAVDGGVMFWGGTPSLKTHDGTDLINDVENIKGKKGDYVDLVSKFKVFPVINVRIAYTLF